MCCYVLVAEIRSYTEALNARFYSFSPSLSALRMRNFNKHRFLKDQRTSGPSGIETSCTLQTQITGLGASASSCSSVTAPFNSMNTLATPTPHTGYSNGTNGRCTGDSARTQGRVSPNNNRKKIRFTVLKNGQDAASYS